MTDRTDRRGFLRSAACVATGALAGCRALTGTRRQWQTSLSSGFVQSPLVDSDGTIFVTTGDGQVHAVAADDGTVRHSVASQPAFYTGPATGSGGLFVGNRAVAEVTLTGDGVLRVGGRSWGNAHLGPGNEVTELVAAGGTLLGGTETGRVYRIDPEQSDADMRVALDADGEIRALVSDGDMHYALAGQSGAAAGEVIALGDGEAAPLWRRSLSRPTDAAVDQSHLFVAHADGVTAVDPSAGETEWTASLAQVRSLAVSESRVYAVTAEPRLVALDRQSAAVLWGATLESPTPTGVSPAVADGQVYVPEGSSGRIVAVAADGSTAWTYDVEVDAPPATTPLAVAESVYVGVGGHLLALRA